MLTQQNEAALKRAAQQQYEMNCKASAADTGSTQMGLGGVYQGSIGGPCRPSLRERIENKLDRSWRESRNLEKLEEFKALAEKHPETIRIVELLNELDLA
jgi:hypothetical protein